MMRRSTNRIWLSSAFGMSLVLPLVLIACGPSLEPLPEPPNLEEVDASVRSQFEELHDRLDGLGADASAAEKAAVHGELGLWFHVYRLPEAAEIAYGNALALDPDAPRWAYFRGILFFQTGRHGEAAKDFLKVLESGYEPAAVRLAEAELELGELDSAIARLEGAAEQSRNVRAKAAMARALLAREESSQADREAAAKWLEKALEEQKGASSLRYQLGTLYQQMGESARAARHLALVDSEAKTAALSMVDPWAAELRGMDVSYIGHIQRGKEASKLGRHMAALRHFAAAEEVDAARFAAPLATVKELLALGRSAEAVEKCQRILERFPEKSEAHLLLGRLYRQSSDPRASGALERALELDPRNLGALRQLAAEKHRLGETAAALQWYEKALELAPGRTQLLVSTADLLDEFGRRGEALALLEQALPVAAEPWAIELKIEDLKTP